MLTLTPLVSHAQNSDEFSIANKRISLPLPTTFALVNDEMVAINQLNQSQEDTLNDLIATYIPETEVGTALSGVLPDMERSFVVKINKELQHEVFTETDFLEMQNVIEEQNSNAFEQIEYEITRQLKDTEAISGSDLDLDNALKVSKIIPLEVHYKDNQLFSHSMYINYGKNIDDKEDNIVAATLNYLNLDGTVLFVYAFAPQQDLLWTQNSSLEWSKNILATNQTSLLPFSRPFLINLFLLLAFLLIVIVIKMKKS